MFTDILNNGKTLRHGQDDNGLYWAEIRDLDGLVESAGSFTTANERNAWIIEHEG